MRVKNVFISYPSQSVDKMRELAERLEKKNFYRIWRDDKHIQPGDIISNQLKNGFRESDCCVLVLSKHTEKSAWCMQEVGAFWGAGKPIIVYLTDRSVRPPALFAGMKLANTLDEVVEGLLDLPPLPRPIVKDVFPHAEEEDFRNLMKSLALRAKRIRLIGTGLEILGDSHFRTDILRRAAAGQCRLEVYLGDPYSPAVEARLIEENLGDPVPVPLGRDGIINRARRLTEGWHSYRSPKGKFEVRLFTHYPTFALLIFDDDYFFYPYGAARLGNFSPVFQLIGGVPESKEVVKFFEDHYTCVRGSSTSMQRLTSNEEAESGLENNGDLDVGELWAFALYYVPPANSPLYQWGSKILGYDLWNKTPLDSEWEKSVGDARAFGFHLTLCDALYFLEEAAVKAVVAEAKYIAREFEPFKLELSDCQVVAGFPDESSISIVPKDPTGTIEALHYEFVHRIYRRAVASNYSLGKAEPTRDKELGRAHLMIKRYLAPYILGRFCPHFTLLTKVEPSKRHEFHAQLSQEYDEVVRKALASGKPFVRFDQLAIMYKPKPTPKDLEPRWVIFDKDEIALGRAVRPS